MKTTVSIFWFRRDLRLYDNAALFHALKSGVPVLPIFIFDRYILDDLEDRTDKRVAFIYQSLIALQEQLTDVGSTLQVYHGFPEETFNDLLLKYTVSAVYVNHDYEPYARKRDEAIAALLAKQNIAIHSYKDQVIFEKKEVIKDDGLPYTVFSPYSRKWLAKFNLEGIDKFESEKYTSHFFRQERQPVPTLEMIGFSNNGFEFPSHQVEDYLLKQYQKQRDFPGLNGTSRIGVHLRFGTISIRKMVAAATLLSNTFLNELIWREFYQMILWNFPQVGEGRAFKPAYDRIPWRNDETAFDRWASGNTGYPIVDAGMRELNNTGFMHNRVRMVVASFLTKHLLIDWRWGEAYFAQKLLDFELASNNGGWQWASGSGCDAAPFFRIFNPYLQTKKFDPDLEYISQWVPEFQEFSYPAPIVEHEFARKRCLEVYGKALSEN